MLRHANVITDITVDKLVLSDNPRRRGVIFQALDVTPVGFYFEGGQPFPLILPSNYSSFTFNTRDFPYFGKVYLVNHTDAGTSAAMLRVIEVSD